MNNIQNTYNQQPIPMGMPVMPRRQMRGRWKVIDLFPKWLSQYAIGVYVAALLVVSFMYSNYSMPWYYMLSGITALIIFFLYGSTLEKKTALDKMRNESRFERRILLVAFIPRILFTLLLYWIFQTNYGDAFGFENGDATFYNDLARVFSDAMKNNRFLDEWKNANETIDVSDLGYATYIAAIYQLTGDSVLFVRILKCIWSSLTVLLLYKLANRNFGPQVARLAAIFCALWPNFWYYCTGHLKEVEMVFLAVLFIEQADQMLRSRQFTAWKVVPILLIAAAMFTFRTILGIVALLALVFAVVMSSSKVVNWGKRFIIGGLAIILIGVIAGNSIQERTMELYEQVQKGGQQENMSWRSERKDGNAFAKYAGASVFAPMIFTLPFPTMVRPFEGQEVQQLLNGGNFIKNIISAFSILAIVLLLISGRWRDHLLPLSFVLGYLVVLTMSSFAQAERFHQPAMPFEMMFAAYGLSIAVTKPKYKQWFTYWCGLMFIAAIVWNWFKLAGRGLT